MKYDCSDEFNLCEIFCKLTAPQTPCPTMVAACDFFAPQFTLTEFQAAVQRCRNLSDRT